MKIFKNLLLSLTMLSLFSCTTMINKSQTNGSIDISIAGNLKADIDVDMSRKLKGVGSESVLFGMIKMKSARNYLDGVTYGGGESGGGFFSDGAISRAKAAAAYDAIKKAGDVDVLVAPQYTVHQSKVFFGAYRTVSVQVVGYAGKIKSIKNANK